MQSYKNKYNHNEHFTQKYKLACMQLHTYPGNYIRAHTYTLTQTHAFTTQTNHILIYTLAQTHTQNGHIHIYTLNIHTLIALHINTRA